MTDQSELPERPKRLNYNGPREMRAWALGHTTTHTPEPPRPWKEVLLAWAIGLALGFVLAGVFVATNPPCKADPIGALIRGGYNAR